MPKLILKASFYHILLKFIQFMWDVPVSFKLITIFWKTITSIKCWWVIAALSEGGGHAVDDVAEDLLQPSEPVSHLPESAVSQGALHAVAGAWVGIMWDIWKNMMCFLEASECLNQCWGLNSKSLKRKEKVHCVVGKNYFSGKEKFVYVLLWTSVA